MPTQKNKHLGKVSLKNYSILIMTLLFLNGLLSACTAQKSPTPTQDANSPLIRARIGVNPDLAPFETYDSTKQEVSGFDVELLKTAGARANIYIEFVRITAGYQPLIAQINQCSLDGAISAIPVTEAARQQMEFSEPYYTTGQVLVVKKGNIKINGLDSLSGMTVGTQENTPSALEVEKIQGIKPKLFESFYLAFQELIAGNIDAVIADHPRAWKYVQVKPNNLKIVGKEFGSVSYAVAFCKNQSGIMQQISTELANMKKDGSLDLLIKKWRLGIYGEAD